MDEPFDNSSAGGRINSQITELEALKNDYLEGHITVDSAGGTYNDAIDALQDEYDNKSYWVNQWNADNSIATVSEKDQWIQDRDDALELRTQIINDGAANFTPTSFAIAQIDVKLNSLGNELLSLAPASIQQQINTQMQFLEAKKMQLNAGAVDVIQLVSFMPQQAMLKYLQIILSARQMAGLSQKTKLVSLLSIIPTAQLRPTISTFPMTLAAPSIIMSRSFAIHQM